MDVVWKDDFLLVLNVSAELPRHRNFPKGTDVVDPKTHKAPTGSYIAIPNRRIERVFYHQTLGSYAAGRKGLDSTASFFIRDPQYDSLGRWKGNGRGWPGFAYTLFVPFEPEICEGLAVVYLCWDWDWVTYHTGGGWNARSVAVAFQGFFRSRHIPGFKPFPETDGRPSATQMEIARRLWFRFLKPKLELTDEQLDGHYRAGKPACPGDDLEDLIRSINSGHMTDTQPDAQPLDSWPLRQAALVALGYHLGPFGPKKNGVDGKPGERTRAAIESFETYHALPVDGIWDSALERRVIAELAANNIARKDLVDLM